MHSHTTEDRLSVNVGAAVLVAQAHHLATERAKGFLALLIERPCGLPISFFVCPMQAPEALNLLDAAKGEFFADAFAAERWLADAWMRGTYRPARAA